MYSLPIIINNRREVISELLENNADTNGRAFVVECTQNTYFNIFTIDVHTIIKTFIEGTSDLVFKNMQASCSYEAIRKKFIIQLTPGAVPNMPPPAEVVAKKIAFYEDLDDMEFIEEPNPTATHKPSDVITNRQEFLDASQDIKFLFQQVNDALQLKLKCESNLGNTNTFDIDYIYVCLELLVNGKKYSATHQLHLSHPSEFIGMAIDFGSEASQLVVTRFEPSSGVQMEQPTNENLFQNIKKFHEFKGWIVPGTQAYYQEEKNTNFYKSIFFLKGNLGSNYENFVTERYIIDQQENLKMMVDKDSSGFLSDNNYKQLPNLKITHKQDNILSSIHLSYDDNGYSIDVNLNQITQKVSNTILKTMIESFLKKELIQNKVGNRKIRLIVLVPNIYDSDSVHIVQTSVSNILADLAKLPDYKDRLVAWEVMAVSESDSAFIGYMSKHNVQVQANKEYIIIDAGKGTTDFSILRTGANNIFNIKPIYRNGFAGAGNLITNAIFETLLHFIQEQSGAKPGVQKFIRERIINVLASDLAMRNNLFNELERLKFNFTDNAVIKTQWQQSKSGEIDFSKIVESGADLKTIVDILSNIDRVADFYGYINDVCEMITEKVTLQLDMVKTNMSNFDIAGVVLTGRGFLFAPLAIKMQVKLSERLGITTACMEVLKGNELKDVCIKGVFNKTIRINSELIGYPIQRVKATNIRVPEAQPTEVKATKWYKKLLGSIDDYASYKQKIVVNNKLDYKSLQNSEIIIGANSYTVDDPDMFQNMNTGLYNCTIDYTRNGYRVRRHHNGIVDQIASLHVTIKIDNPDLHMIVPSLFPNYVDDAYLESLKIDPSILLASIPTAMVSNDLLFGAVDNITSPSSLNKRDDLLF